MEPDEIRSNLDRLIRERGESYGAISQLIGRNAAYIQQFVKRGTPRKLDEGDRARIARYFGVDEQMLGGPAVSGPIPSPVRGRGSLAPMIAVPRLALGASAGSGTFDEDENAAGALAFDARWLRALGGQPDALSIIRVDGESMAPTLQDGDDIMVDRGDDAARLRDGIYVLRMEDLLMVKRVALTPRRGQISVRSDNPLYPSWDDIDASGVTIVGRVIWTGRRVG